MKRDDFYFDSRDNATKIHAVRWEPESGKPEYIVQIIHGMAEHVERYAAFAEFLTAQGCVVVAEDHLGHGKTAENGTYGYFCKQDPATVVVRDVHRLKKLTQERYPGVPYYILGHSMGSFILRNYLFRYGKGIDGAIIMGTGQQPLYLPIGLKCTSALASLFGGAAKPSEFINKASFGTYLKRIPNPRTNYDWLTKDEKIVDQYIADPQCGFTFTGNGFKTLAELILRLNRKSNLSKMPVTLRVLIMSGGEDPVGDYGEGPKKVLEQFKAEGMQRVTLKIYEGDRHELLNELDKEQVYKDIWQWITNP